MQPCCPLCSGPSEPFYQWKLRIYHKCLECYGVFLDPSLYPSPISEKNRYLEHNNNAMDPKYREFVSPITRFVYNHFKNNDIGLDFGSGTDSAIAKVLEEQTFQIHRYDPFFQKDDSLLYQKYNYITCCEVMEHFHDPPKEFNLLRSLLLPRGKLICMTNLFHEDINFHLWYYKNDQTHVYFYHKESIEWIRKKFNFSSVSIDGMLIVFDSE
jgi:hypothetical protein